MPQTAVVLKVAYLHRKRTWRRIAILGRQTLDDLALAINAAFERDNDHLYSFFFPDPCPEGPMTSRPKVHDAPEYTHPFNAEDPGPFCDKPLRNAAKTKIASLGLAPKQRFLCHHSSPKSKRYRKVRPALSPRADSLVVPAFFGRRPPKGLGSAALNGCVYSWASRRAACPLRPGRGKKNEYMCSSSRSKV